MKYADLTPELERELVMRYQAGDREAGAALLSAHWPILVRLMQRLFRRGVSDADVMQTACAEFLDRARRWDCSPSCRLTSWASQGAFYATKTAVWEDTTIRVSEYALTRRTKLRKARAGIPSSLLLQLMMRATENLDQVIGEDDALTIQDVTPSASPDPESLLTETEVAAERSALYKAALGALSDRERALIDRRVLADDPETLRVIGPSMGVTDETAGAWLRRAMEKMRRAVHEAMGEQDLRVLASGRPANDNRPEVA